MVLRKKQIVKLLALFLVNALVMVILTYSDRRSQSESSWHLISQAIGHHKRHVANNRTRTILFWNGARRAEMTIFGTGKEVFGQHRCPVSDCEIVNSIHQYPNRPLDSFDAILVNFNDEFWVTGRPKFARQPHQRIVFFTQEPPPSLKPLNISQYRNYFNWTMSYRMDSDVRLLYGRIRPKFSAPRTAEEVQIKIEETHKEDKRRGSKRKKGKKKKRRKMVAAMISHCNTDGRREEYIRQLKKHIKVDIYGWCNEEGHNKLRCETDELLSSTPDCYEMIEDHYMFYLSFENSICADYVTEKFFQIMQHDLVPIVYGGANYSKIAPPHSYIDARKYKPSQLAVYLKTLAANQTLYNEYFWWKNDYVVEAGLEQMMSHGFCDLCQRLHQDEAHKTYSSLAKEWDASRCHRPKMPGEKKQTANREKPLVLSSKNMLNYIFHRGNGERR